jgi:hypothetical protein
MDCWACSGSAAACAAARTSGASRPTSPAARPCCSTPTASQFADLAPVEHDVVALESLPEFVPAAFLAVEDKRFYEHNGIDFRRVGGASLADIRARGFVQGFSTITMQLARNVWPDRLPGRQRTSPARSSRSAWPTTSSGTTPRTRSSSCTSTTSTSAAARTASRPPAATTSASPRAADARGGGVLAALPKSPTPTTRGASPSARARAATSCCASWRSRADHGGAEPRAPPTAPRRPAEPPRRRRDRHAPYFVEARAASSRTASARTSTRADARAHHARPAGPAHRRAAARAAAPGHRARRLGRYSGAALQRLDAGRRAGVRAGRRRPPGRRDRRRPRPRRRPRLLCTPASTAPPRRGASRAARSSRSSTRPPRGRLRAQPARLGFRAALELAGGEVWEPRNRRAATRAPSPSAMRSSGPRTCPPSASPPTWD